MGKRHFTTEPEIPEDMSREHVYEHSGYLWDMKVLDLMRTGRTRELILDFTLKVGAEDPTPPEARVARALESAIRSARDAGWDPESRGRAFRFEVAGKL